MAAALTPAERAALARAMAGRVVAAAGDAPTFVVCDDDEVADWAETTGAIVLWRPGHGLNPAVTDGVVTICGKGYEHVVVAHSDLPLATRLEHLVTPGTITLVPDRHGGGTNVISLPCAERFEFSYGHGSFRRHLALASAIGRPIEVVRDEELGFDLDTPADLAHPSIEEVLPSIWQRPTNPASRR